MQKLEQYSLEINTILSANEGWRAGYEKIQINLTDETFLGTHTVVYNLFYRWLRASEYT